MSTGEPARNTSVSIAHSIVVQLVKQSSVGDLVERFGQVRASTFQELDPLPGIWCTESQGRFKLFGDSLEEATENTVSSCCFPWVQVLLPQLVQLFFSPDSDYRHVCRTVVRY